MKKRNLSILLALSILALSQLMCGGNAWTRDPIMKSNGIYLCTGYQVQLEDGTPVTGVCMDNCLGKTDSTGYYTRNSQGSCSIYPTQAECNGLNAAGVVGSPPAGYTIVSQSATSFDCSDQPKNLTQTRILTMVVAPIQTSIDQQTPLESNSVQQPAAAQSSTVSMASVLGGGVSYCTVSGDQNYVNLPFNATADPAAVQSALTAGTLTVKIGTTVGACTVDAANRLMTCGFPSSAFTASTTINVLDGSTVIDTVLYDGICTSPAVGSQGGAGGSGADAFGTGGTGGAGGAGGTGGSGATGGTGATGGAGGAGGSGGSVPACDPHLDPACPLDCSIPANADLCG